jgi:hypothetical protein
VLSLAVMLGIIAILTASAVQVFKRGEDDSALGAVSLRWRR